MNPSSFDNPPALRPGTSCCSMGTDSCRGPSDGSTNRTWTARRSSSGRRTMAEATASGLRHVAIEPAVKGTRSRYVRRLATGGRLRCPVAERALSFTPDLAVHGRSGSCCSAMPRDDPEAADR